MSDEVNEKRREVAKAMGFPNAARLPPPQRAALDALVLAARRDGARLMREAAAKAAGTNFVNDAGLVRDLDIDTVIKEPRRAPA